MQTHSSPQTKAALSPLTPSFHRRRLIKCLFVGALCLIALDSGAASAEDAKGQNDREFAEVIAAIANIRKANRSTAIDVTSQFKPMTDHLSLTELKDYISSLGPYQHRRATSRGITYDLIDIDERGLKSFDGAFLYLDSLSMTFDYGEDGKTVTKFISVLLNGQL
jgi:hypothetical protein